MPLLTKPVTVSKDFFGYEIAYFQGKLYSFPVQDGPFDPFHKNKYLSSESSKTLAFGIIDLLKKSKDEWIWIDSAYGYSIYKCGRIYIAPNMEKDISETDIYEHHHSHNLEELYEILYSEHIKNIEVYVHTGLPKTATTYLQNHVFPYLKDVHYIAKDGENEFFNKYFIKIRFGNHIIVQDEIHQQFLEYLKFVDEKKILISEEALSEPRNNGRHFMPNTLILEKIFPSVKIIFTIRYQVDFIESFYLQDLRVGGYMGIDAFLRYNKKMKKFLEFESTLIPKISVYYLDYNKFIDFYIDIYGRNNVKVMIFEHFKKDKKDFINNLCNFIGTNFTNPISKDIEHRSYKWITAYWALWLNRLTYSKDGKLGIIVERPFVKSLDSMIEFLTRKLNTTNMGTYKAFSYKGIRFFLRILRNLLLKITVEYFLILLNQFFIYTRIASNRKIINIEKTEILRKLYNKLNKNLDKKYSLNLREYNYYD